GRDYFSQLPFEHIDTLAGGLTLTFTDLVLPGNAGFDLKFQRSYNSKNHQWTFGIAGVPMYVTNNASYPPITPFNVDTAQRPSLLTSDGGKPLTTWLDHPLSFDATTARWVVTSAFWRYDRADGAVYMPNGVIGHYDTSGRLINAADAFGNGITLTWDTGE